MNRACETGARASLELACAIAVMAKASAVGRAKTRLAPPLTLEEAAEFNSAFLRDVADNLIAAGSQAAIKGWMAYGPPGSQDFFTALLPRGIGLFECWFEDFGACLANAVSAMLGEGCGSAVVLNADSPTLPTAFLVETARRLARPGDRAVLGPAADGGYYLLGLKAPHRRLFEDIAWSTESVAEETIERAREIGLELEMLPTWYDVDTLASLQILHGELFENRRYSAAAEASPARHTRALVERLLASTDLARRAGFARNAPRRRTEGRASPAIVSPLSDGAA